MINKKAQQSMSLPFGMIFSIFLIVIFIITAIWGIKYFLNVGDCSKVGYFYENLQREVDRAYQSQSSDHFCGFNNLDDSVECQFILPSGVEKICIGNLSEPITANVNDYNQISIYDYEDANTYIVPPEKACEIPYKKILHINISTITQSKNPFCFSVNEKIRIKKDFYDRSVIISK